MTKKRRKWTLKRHRKMKWMNKRREMIYVGDSEEENSDNTQTSHDEGKTMVIRRRWLCGKSKKKARKVPKMGTSKKMKKRHHKKSHQQAVVFLFLRLSNLKSSGI